MRLTPLMAGVAAVVALQACRLEKPFERTNPFDSGGLAEITLGGPDSVHAIAQHFVLELESSIGWPEGELFIGWDSSEPQVLPLARGEFIVHRATARYVPVRLSASLNDVLVARTVHVGQRASSLEISCAPPSAPIAPCDAPPLPVGGTRYAYVLLYDANLRSVFDAPHALGRDGSAVASRDAAIAEISLLPNAAAALRVTGVGAGGTWIVLTVDDAIDSVRVEVTP